MSIKYLCSECSKQLELSGVKAVNAVGRKSCSVCGSNDDDLCVVSASQLTWSRDKKLLEQDEADNRENDKTDIERPTCETCVYWERCTYEILSTSETSLNSNTKVGYHTYGDCRNKPPVSVEDLWPRTQITDWCGKHPEYSVYMKVLKTNLWKQFIKEQI